MIHDIQDILSKVYELEGLLLLTQNRADSVDAQLSETLSKKISEVSSALACLQGQIGSQGNSQSTIIDKRTSDSIEALDATSEPQTKVDEKFIKLESDEDDIIEVQAVLDEPSEDESESSSATEENAEDEDTITADDDETTLTGIEAEEPETVTVEAELVEGAKDTAVDDDETEEIKEAVKAEVNAQRTVEDESTFSDADDETESIKEAVKADVNAQQTEVADDVTSSHDDDKLDSIKDDVIAQVAAKSKEEKSSSEPSEFQNFIDLDELEEPVSVSDAYLNNISKKDLKRAFSINDQYYYRRVLFDNDAARFNAAIEKVQDMEYFDEAQQYFYDQLHWDEDDRTVKRFMAKIESHFD